MGAEPGEVLNVVLRIFTRFSKQTSSDVLILTFTLQGFHSLDFVLWNAIKFSESRFRPSTCTHDIKYMYMQCSPSYMHCILNEGVKKKVQ